MRYCGYRTGKIWDQSRAHWRDGSARPIAWSAWYPATDAGAGKQLAEPFFEPGGILLDAALAPIEKLPVVLLSHGTGGTAETLGWLARALARQGYVVLGANHHGNTGREPYLPEGFLCWWERAPDLSVLLTSLSQEGFFAGRLDLEQVFAVGFSLGGHAVMALAGGRSSMAEFEAWARASNFTQVGPKEFPGVGDQIPILRETSEVFRASWDRQGEDFADPRIKSVVAIAPAPTIRSFVPQSVSGITLPLAIVTGGADLEAPTEHCADWAVSLNNGFQHYDLGRHVGHYTFLEFPADRSLIGQVDIFTDHESVDRGQVHSQTIDIVSKWLGAGH